MLTEEQYSKKIEALMRSREKSELLNAGKKECTKCKVIQPIDQFNIASKSKNGFTVRRGDCKACIILKNRKYYKSKIKDKKEK